MSHRLYRALATATRFSTRLTGHQPTGNSAITSMARRRLLQGRICVPEDVHGLPRCVATAALSPGAEARPAAGPPIEDVFQKVSAPKVCPMCKNRLLYCIPDGMFVFYINYNGWISRLNPFFSLLRRFFPALQPAFPAAGPTGAGACGELCPGQRGLCLSPAQLSRPVGAGPMRALDRDGDAGPRGAGKKPGGALPYPQHFPAGRYGALRRLVWAHRRGQGCDLMGLFSFPVRPGGAAATVYPAPLRMPAPDFSPLCQHRSPRAMRGGGFSEVMKSANTGRRPMRVHWKLSQDDELSSGEPQRRSAAC
jgi:hypothetical protein